MPVLNPVLIGGKTLSSQGPLDPVEVYQQTRPSDWLKLPVPSENEICLLIHIPDGLSSLLAFSVTCTGNYTVKMLSNGSETTLATQASGAKFETNLYASNYGNLTSDGFKQVVLKITGSDIRAWTPSVHTKKTSPSDFASWNIVEIACNLPKGTSVACGNSVKNMALKKLRYFTWYGANAVVDMSNMFRYCYSLVSIPQLYTSSVNNMSYMFHSCSALTAVPQFDTSSVTDMSYMFYGCSALITIPQINTPSVTNMTFMFRNCFSLVTMPQLDTSSVTNMNNMFYCCYSLAFIPQFDTSSVTNMSNMFNMCNSLAAVPLLDTSSVTSMSKPFSGCYSLSSLRLNPLVVNWAGCALDLSECSLEHSAIVALLNSLPAISSAKNLTLTGNPGANELSDSEKAIAANKRWTLVL